VAGATGLAGRLLLLLVLVTLLLFLLQQLLLLLMCPLPVLRLPPLALLLPASSPDLARRNHIHRTIPSAHPDSTLWLPAPGV
jgi:hypothetical protein